VLRTSMKMAAAALAAGAVLTACGPVKMGAAAVMTSQRISTSTLAAEVSNLNQGYLKYKGKITLQYPVSQMPQQVLGWLVRFRVRDQLAAASGIRVTPAQVQSALAAITSQAQSSTPATKVHLGELAVANGLPPNLLTSLARYQAIQSDLVSRMDGGTLPKSAAALQALGTQFTKAECLAAKGLDITINPQFGRLDYSQYSIIPAPAVLSATGPSPSPSPAASPSATPQLTPAC
jgi:hypothetical protein